MTAALNFRTVDVRGAQLSLAGLRAAVPRAQSGTMADAEEQGPGHHLRRPHARLRRTAGAGAGFDGVEQAHPRVPAEALRAALEGLDPAVRAALEESIRRARDFADAQRPANIDVELGEGAVVSQNWVPVARVGLYVPGGLAVYPSSVIMNVVPALAAGVESIALASPPQKDFGGLPHPTILAAACLLGIEEVYAIGGAQAIAAFAYGIPADASDAGNLPGIDPVDVVTGPGNIFVATAKRLVKGVVGIDSEAGTTEIAILADSTASPALVAADLISQAEHDPKAASVLFTDSEALAADVRVELERQAAATKHSSRVREALSGPQSGVVLVEDLEQGIAACDAYAAEHLEIMTADAARGGRPDPQRRCDLRGGLQPREPGRLLRRLQPRAAHQRHGGLLLRTERDHVPARHPGHQLQPGRVGAGQRPYRQPLRRGGPAGARRGRHGAVRRPVAQDPDHYM